MSYFLFSFIIFTLNNVVSIRLSTTRQQLSQSNYGDWLSTRQNVHQEDFHKLPPLLVRLHSLLVSHSVVTSSFLLLTSPFPLSLLYTNLLSFYSSIVICWLPYSYSSSQDTINSQSIDCSVALHSPIVVVIILMGVWLVPPIGLQYKLCLRNKFTTFSFCTSYNVDLNWL